MDRNIAEWCTSLARASHCAILRVAFLVSALSFCGAAPTRAQALQLDPLFAPELHISGGAPYAAVVQSDGKLLVGGDFKWVNGAYRPSLVRFNIDGTVDTTFDAHIEDGAVYALLIQSDGKIVAGGVFTTVAGMTHSALVRVTATGAVDGAFSASAGVNGIVRALAMDASGSIFAGGQFATASGVARTSLAKFNSDGSLATGFQPNLAGPYVYALPIVSAVIALPSGRVAVGGQFATVSSVATGGLAVLDSSGVLDSAWSLRAPGLISSVLARDSAGQLYASVQNSSYGTAWPFGHAVVRFTSSFAPDTSWGIPYTGTQLYAIAPLDSGEFLIGSNRGGFDASSSIGPITRYLSDGTRDATYPKAIAPGIATAFAKSGATVYAVGVGGGTADDSAVCVLDAHGTPVRAWQPRLQSAGTVSAAAVQPDGKTILAGIFDSVGTQPAHGFVRLTSSGRVDLSFTADVTLGAMTSLLLQSDGKLLVRTQNNYYSTLLRLNSDGSVDGTYSAGASNFSIDAPWALRPDGKLVIASGNALYRFDTTGKQEASPYTYVYYPTLLTMQPDGHIVIGGNFGQAGPDYRTQPYLARVDADGNFDATFTSPLSATMSYYPPISALRSAADGRLFVAGMLVWPDSSTAGLARLTSAGVRDTTFASSVTSSDHIVGIVPRSDGGAVIAGNIAGVGRIRVVQTNGAFDSTDVTLQSPVSVNALVGGAGDDVVVAGQFAGVGGLIRYGVARLTARTAFAQVAESASAAAGTTLTVVPQLGTNTGATYQWRREGAAVSGATQSTLTLTSFDPTSQSGNYTLVVTSGGVTFETDPVSVAADSAPTIVTQPAALVEDVGGTAVFSVTATGSPAPTYAWRKDGVAISGATDATLRVSILQASDAGQYSVVVSNRAGSVASSAATLTVRNLRLDTLFKPLLVRDAIGSVASFYALADGRAIASGTFQAVNGATSPSFVSLSATGQVNTSFSSEYAGTPLAMLADGRVLVYGAQYYNGTSWVYPLRLLDTSGHLVAGFQFDIATGISNLRVFQVGAALILANGDGLAVGGVNAANGVARVRLDGTLDSGFTVGTIGGSPRVNVLGVTADGKLYLQYYEYSGGSYNQHFLRTTATGSLDSTFAVTIPDSYAYNGLSAVVQADGRLVVGLTPSSANPQGLVRFNLDGSVDTAFRSALPTGGDSSSGLKPLGVYGDGRLLVRSGDSHWWRISATGARDSAFDIADTSNLKLVAILSDNSILAWTTYSSPGGTTVRRFDSSGQTVTTGIPRFGVAADVGAVAYEPGGSIYVAGNFDWVNGISHRGLARLFPTGQTDASFAATLAADETIGLIGVQSDGRLVIAGSLHQTTGDGLANRVVRLQLDGTRDAQFAVAFDGTVRDLAIGADDSVYVAGGFSTAGGAPRARIARVFSFGAVDLGFSPTFRPDAASAIALQSDGKVVVAYYSSQYNGGTTVVRLLTSGATDSSWHTASLGGYGGRIAVDPQGRTLVFTGSGVTRLLATGERDGGFAVSFNATNVAAAIEPSSGKVTIGGGFSAINGVAQYALGRVRADGGVDSSLRPTIANTPNNTASVSSLALRSDGDLLAGGSFTSVDGAALTALARWTVHEFAITFGSATQVSTTGGNATLSMQVQGTGPFSYQWRKDGIDIAGATDATLAIASVTSASGGAYTLKVDNGHETQVSDAIRLAVTQAPTITQQPSSASVSIGGAAQFSVQVAAIPDPTFQWYKDGVAIAGARGQSLLLPQVSAGDAGSYAVTVTNAAGTVSSGAATLTVTGARIDRGFAPAFTLTGSEAGTALRVTAAIRLADGRWLIGGNFTTINSVLAPFLARLNADGTVDRTYAGPGPWMAPVRSFTRLSDGKIMIACGADAYSSTVTTLAIRVLADGTADPAFSPLRGTGYVTAIAERATGGIYVGGSFSVGSMQNLLRLAADGSVDVTFAAKANDNGTVSSVAVLNDNVFVGFDRSYSSTTASPLRRYLADGTLDTTWAPTFASNYYAASVTSLIATDTGQLVAAGRFVSVNGVTCRGLVRLNADATVDTAFAAAIWLNDSGYPVLWKVSGGSIVVSGQSSLGGQQPGTTGVRLRTDGSVERIYGFSGLQMTAEIADIDPTERVTVLPVVGGYWYSAVGLAFPTIVSFAADGSLADNFTFDLDAAGRVTAVAAMPDGRLIVAGEFSSVDGESRVRVARLLPGGSPDPTFVPAVLTSNSGYSSNPAVRAIAVQADNRIILAGSFSSFNGAIRNNIVRLNADGTIDGAYNPAPNGSVNSVAVDSAGRLVAGGEFTTIGGGAAPRLARLAIDGALDSTFQPAIPADCIYVKAIVIDSSGKIAYSAALSGSQKLARLQADGTVDATFASANVFATALAFLSDGRLVGLIGGTYSNPSQVRLFGANGVEDTTFSATFRDTSSDYGTNLKSLLVQPNDCIVVVGSFSSVNGQPRAGAVRLLTDGRVDPSFFPGLGSSPAGSAATVAQQPDASIVIGGAFTEFDGLRCGGLVRYVDRAFFVRVLQSEVVAASGSAASLGVDISGAGSFTYAWKHEGSPLSGATARTLSLAAVTSAEAGNYTCSVTSGTVTVASDPILLRIGAAPSFTVQPQSVQIAPSSTLTLTATVTGDAPITYQWYLNGNTISGATASSFAITPANVNGSGLYQVIATNAYGSAVSRLASVVIGSAPTISSQPADVVLSEGNTLYLYLNVSGSPSPTVQWRRNGVALPGVLGYSASMYNVKASDAGTYSAVATNTFGSVTSSTFQVFVNPSTTTPPAIQTQPSSVTAFMADGFSFSVAATGNPSPTYQWRHNGVAIPGATYSTYSKYSYSVQPSDAGDYDVIVSSSAGTVTSSTATLTLKQSPYFAQSPGAQQIMVGGTAVFSASVVAVPAATLQWKKDGVAIAGATDAVLVVRNVQTSDMGDYTVTATNTYGTATSTAATLTVSTILQRGLTAGVARVNAGPTGVTTTFSIEGSAPKRMLVRAVGPTLASLGVSGVMTDPMIVLTDASGAYVAHNNNWGDAANPSDIALTATRLGALSLAATSKDAALIVTLAPGTYTATVSAADGVAGIVLVEVYEADAVQRLVQLSLRGPVGSGTAVLSCGFNVVGSIARPYLIRALGPVLGTSSAIADPRLALFSGNTQLATNDDWSSDTADATQLTSAVARVGAVALPSGSKDAAMLVTLSAGSYVAQVSAPEGTSGETILEIIEADSLRDTTQRPGFVLMPASQDVPAGSSVTLSSLASGAPAPAYQWQKDGAPINGATAASYTLSNFQDSQAGAYTVVATNSAGSATSLPAILAVGSGVAPRATHSVIGGGYRESTTVTITNTLVYSGTASSIAWSATLPTGWSYAGGESEGDVKPADGATGTIGWSWTTPPASPVTFTYRLNVPAGEAAIRALTATATIRTATAAVRTIVANPSPLPLVPSSMLHSADTDHDFRISLVELTRVIELYNTRNGTTRTGCYVVQSGSEDGFAPDPSRASSATATFTTFHAADSNHDGKISLVELTRVIELYNYRSGTTRTGQYHVQLGTEDGFAPAP